MNAPKHAGERPYSAVRELKETMGFTDDELAEVLQCSRSHVQSLASGRYREHFTPAQRAALLYHVKAYREQVDRVAEKVEILI